MRACVVKGVEVECDDYRQREYDARGIYLCTICTKCAKQKLSAYRRDVLSDPNYDADEPIEPDY